MQEKIQKQLEKFIEKKSEKKKIIVIFGPTASGKTGLSIKVAKIINSEIISTDSRQIFKYLDIGTGKITREEKEGIKHYMIDIIEPSEKYSVGEFKKSSEENLEKIWNLGKIPILCGGTGLYIDSLIYDFDIPEIPADVELREKLENEAKEFGKEYLYKKLVKLDPEYAKTLHHNNVQYVVRALEIKLISGKSKSEFIKEKILKYDVLFLTPYEGDREKLYENINLRVKQMFDEGLVEEVKNLLNKGFKTDDFGLQTIGYKEVLEFLDQKISLEEAIEQVQQNSRNYAKRQLTWFRKYEN